MVGLIECREEVYHLPCLWGLGVLCAHNDCIPPVSRALSNGSCPCQKQGLNAQDSVQELVC